MRWTMKREITTFLQYFVIAILALIGAETIIFLIVVGSETGEINMAGYFHKNLDGRLFWMSIFFFIIGILRLFVLMVTNRVRREGEGV
jgi:uncharacterized membrane protein